MIPWLDPEAAPAFPPVSEALKEPEGLLAAGGQLTPDWLSAAYARGIFPWFNEDDPILWWSPDPRMVLFPQEFHVSGSLKRVINQAKFDFTTNRCFSEVVDRCALPRTTQSGTWITQEMRSAYIEFHRLGLATSFEVWQQADLVGGVYGPKIGNILFGESMFSSASNASKFALYKICRADEGNGLKMIDCQLYSDHLASLGARLIPRADFLGLLQPTQ